MQIYEVRISRDALQDMARLRAFLLEMMSEDGAVRYANNMRAEIKMLSVFANLYRKTSSKTFLQIHPEARHMVSHNRRWDYVFHKEDLIDNSIKQTPIQSPIPYSSLQE